MKEHLKYWLWDADMSGLEGRNWRRLATTYVVLLAVLHSLFFPLYMNQVAFLGSGLGDEDATSAWRELFARMDAWGEALNSPLPLWIVVALAVGGVLFRIYTQFRSYFKFKAYEGREFPIDIIGTIALANIYNLIAIHVLLLAIGLGSLMLFGEFSIGWTSVEKLAALARDWIDQIPTIFDLHPVLTVFAVYMLHGFFHYWLHRFGHSFRALWLLFHRQHHVPEQMMNQSITDVVFSFPLFILMVVPYTLIFGATSKLFSAEPLYVEFILINLFMVIPEIHAHSTALYYEACKNPIVRWLGWLLLNGPYHYLHHSSEPTDSGKNGAVNMVNIGGGFFGLWDRVFGTFRPLRAQRPKVGLTGNPTLHMNPMRVAIGGLVQLLYELKHNRSWKDRLLIIFGSSNWNPPVSQDFLLQQPPN